MPASRYADVPPSEVILCSNINMARDIECWYFGKKGHNKPDCRMKIGNERFQKSNNCQSGNNRGYLEGGRENNRIKWRVGNNSRGKSTHKNSYKNSEQGNDQNQPMGIITELVSYSTKRSEKTYNEWLDCGENYNFVWDSPVFEDYKPIEPIPVVASSEKFTLRTLGKTDFPFNLGRRVSN